VEQNEERVNIHPAADAARRITGTVIPVDGGEHLTA
jgi:hypothetical protein